MKSPETRIYAANLGKGTKKYIRLVQEKKKKTFFQAYREGKNGFPGTRRESYGNIGSLNISSIFFLFNLYNSKSHEK